MHKFFNNFTAGEWTPLLDARSDLAKYDSATRCLENFRVLPYGGVRFRNGFEFVASNGDKRVRLMPFYRGDNGRFVLAFSDRKLKVFSSTGAEVASLDSPYLESEIFQIQHKQLNDVIYLAHPEHAPRHLIWDGETFSLSEIEWDFPALLDSNVTDVSLVLKNQDDDSVVMASSSPLFDAKHVGSYWCLFHPVPVQSASLAVASGRNTSARFYPDTRNGSRVVFELLVKNLTNGTTPAIPWPSSTEYPYLFVEAGVRQTAFDGLMEKLGTGSTQAWPSGVAVTSGPLILQGDWELRTSGIWNGELRLEQYDEGASRWVIVRSYVSRSERNVLSSGSTLRSSLFRLVFVSMGDQFSADVYQGTRPDSYYVARAIIDCSGVLSTLLRIDSVVDSQHAKVSFIDDPGNWRDEPTTDWSEGAWSDFRGYPSAISFHEQRLCFAGSRHEPNKVWGSQVDDFHNFHLGTKDTDAFAYVFAASEQNRISWLESSIKLQAATSSREFVVSSGRLDEPLTPTNVSVRSEANNGASAVQPALFDRSLLYAGRQGKTLLEMSYDAAADGFSSQELSLLARHITERGIVQIARANLPDPVVFVALADGTLAALTYGKAQNVAAWGRWTTKGAFRSVAVLRGEQDEVWASVERVIETPPVPPIPPIPGVATFSASGTAPVSIVDAGRWQLYVMRFQFTSAEAWKMSYLLKIATHDGLPAAIGNTSAALIGRVDEAYAQTDNELDYIQLGSGLTSAQKAGEVTIPAGNHFIELGFLDADNQNNFNDGMMVASFTIANAETMTSSFLSGAPTYDFTHGDGIDAGTAPPHTVVPATTPWSDIVVDYSPSTGTPGIPGRPGEIRTIYTIERYSAEFDDKAAGAWADCFRRYDLGGVTLKAGKPHFILGSEAHIPLFKGKPVWAVIDGRPFEASVDSAGCIVLPRDCPDAKTVLIGLPYVGKLQTMNADVMLQDGATQSRKKRISGIMPRFYNTCGGKYGPSFDALEDIEFRHTDHDTDATSPLFSGDLVEVWRGGHVRNNAVCVVQDQPLPFTLLGLDLKLEVFGT